MGSERKAKLLRREVYELQEHVAAVGQLPPEEEETIVQLRQSKAFRRAQVVVARKAAKRSLKKRGVV